MKIDPSELSRLTQKPFSSWWVFHDQSLDSLSHVGDSIQMALSGCVDEDDKRWNAAAHFGGVRDVTVNDVPTARLEMGEDDGEILTMKPNGNTMHLHVIWRNHKTREDAFRAFQFVFDAVNVDFHLEAFS